MAGPPSVEPAFPTEALALEHFNESTLSEAIRWINNQNSQPATATANPGTENAAHTPTPATKAATTFIAAHTTEDTDVCLLDECPICLDNYIDDTCVRIIGIQGCTHRIGLACLREMLRRNPNQEKRCPLCRTIWIAEATAPRRPTQLYTGMPSSGLDTLQGLQLYLGQTLHTQDRRMARVIPPDPRPYNGAEEVRSSARTADEEQGQSLRQQMDAPHDSSTRARAAEIALQENYAAEARSFENFNQELESIRQRAHGTSLRGRRSGRGRRPDRRSSRSPTSRLLNRLRSGSGDHASGHEPLAESEIIRPTPLENQRTQVETQRLRAPVANTLLADIAARANFRTNPALQRSLSTRSTRSTSPAHPPRASSLRETSAQVHSTSPGLSDFGIAASQLPTPCETACTLAQNATASVQSAAPTIIGFPSTQQLNARIAALDAREVRLARREVELVLREAELTIREGRLLHPTFVAEILGNQRRRQMDVMDRLLEQQNDLLEALRRGPES